jgi:hypothetical protein
MWQDGDWIKNLILFFDGVALLVPDYLRDKPENVDPAIVAGLRGYQPRLFRAGKTRLVAACPPSQEELSERYWD